MKDCQHCDYYMNDFAVRRACQEWRERFYEKYRYCSLFTHDEVIKEMEDGNDAYVRIERRPVT